MKKLLFTGIAFILMTGFTYAGIPGQLEIGDDAPRTEQGMKEIGGSEVTLSEISGENGLLVIFSCNTCPYVIAWEDRYNRIAEMCKMNGIGFILVNPNEARRSGVDSYDEMKKHAKAKNYDFPYAVDFNHELADAFGAKKTPDVFLFDSDMKLVYKGAIDDNHKSAEAVKKAYLADALTNLIAGEQIKPSSTLAIGCSIKRVQ